MQSKLDSMEKQLSQVQIIHTLPKEDGLLQRKYKRPMLLSPLIKQCEYCGERFQIIYRACTNTRFCGRSCSAKWRMRQPQFLLNLHNPISNIKRADSIKRAFQ